jgi:hypothetical protein
MPAFEIMFTVGFDQKVAATHLRLSLALFVPSRLTVLVPTSASSGPISAATGQFGP